MPSLTTTRTRRCPSCGKTFPATADYFYQIPSNGRLLRCTVNGCHSAYYRARRAAQASGSRVTRSRRGTGQRYGVEIEFTGASREAVARALQGAGIRCSAESYNHSTRSYWKVITDASVSGGGELVSPPLRGAEGLAEIETVCRALHSIGVTVNNTCGLHVHHDMSGHTPETFGRAFRLWMNNQAHIDRLVARGRRAGASQWCRPLTEREVAHITDVATISGIDRRRASFRVDRYKALNVTSFSKYGTVEIRQHQGATNARKINAWIQFGQAIFAYAKASTNTAAFADVNTMLDALVADAGLSADTAAYLKDRAVALGSHQPTTVVQTVDVDGERLDAEGRCPQMFAASVR